MVDVVIVWLWCVLLSYFCNLCRFVAGVVVARTKISGEVGDDITVEREGDDITVQREGDDIAVEREED